MRTIEFAYRPIPIHAPFHTSSAAERFLFGAFGSGKTWAICAEAIAWCLEQPGIRGLIARRTVPELRDTTETVFFEILPHELRMAGEVKRSGGHVESFTFPNGSKVLFRAIDEWEKFKSLNIGFIAWDEVDEFDEESYQGMLSRVRQREPTPEASALGATEITRRAVWSASNPAGHNWCWRRAVNDKTKVPGVEYFKSTSFDNPYLPASYFDYLMQYPEQWIRRYVLCQFDDFAGQIYEEWNWDEHVIKDELKLGNHHVYWMGMDPGTRDPTAGLWVVVDLDGKLSGTPRTLIGVAEYEQNYTSVNQHVREWKKIEAQHKMNVRWRVADPGAITVKDRGTTMGLDRQYARHGYRFALGPKDDKDRIPMLGQLIQMRRFKLTPNCPLTYEALKGYQWEDLSPAMKRKGVDAPERPLHKNTHLVCCAQYLSSKFVKPPKRRLADLNLTPQEELAREVTSITRRQMQRKSVGPGPIV